MENIIIPRPEELEEKIEKFKIGGAIKIHLLTDFDGTLTKQFVDGEKVPSLISKLRSSDKYISSEYATKAKELYAKYHPIEEDPNLALEKKKTKMLEWWKEHYQVLIEMGMTRDILHDLVKNENANFRDGLTKLLNTTKDKNIPIVIISADGIGDAIPMFLEREGLLHDNIYTLSNQMIFDDEGKMIGVKEPVIHSMNKSEVTVRELPIYENLKNRKNVILLGNSLSDLDMIEGFSYDEIINIGFLNSGTEGDIKRYSETFDVVILGDGDMNYINELLEKIL